jgi:predicted TIM-barrel fold metal-dependent hydrolase
MPDCVDFHTHIFPDRVAGKALAAVGATYRATPEGPATAGGLREAMDEAGVSQAVLCPVATRPDQVRSINKWIARLDRERFIPFGAIHPGLDDVDSEIAWLRRHDIRGVKLQPHFQGYELGDDATLRMIDKLAEMVIVIHGGDEMAPIPNVPTTPERLSSLHERFPEHRLVLAHLGGYGMWQGVEERLVGQGVYFDLSFTFDKLPDEDVARIIAAHGVDRILFASDYPWQRPATALAGLRRLGLPARQEQMILAGNARRLLGA